jgi:mono/diheme cytochrome c family protein
MKFFTGFIIGILVVLAAAYFVGTSGIISVAATRHGGLWGPADVFLAKASDASVERHAPKMKNPYGGDPSAIATGLRHYRENCIDCHGARDIDTTEFAKGLMPGPPMLDMKDVQEMSDGEMYWIVSHGLRMTGMPAFSPTHSDEEIWKIVAFVRHLPKLTDAEVAELRQGEEGAQHREENSEPASSKPVSQ